MFASLMLAALVGAGPMPVPESYADTLGEARSLNDVGFAASRTEEVREALDYFRHALGEKRAAHDACGEARVLASIGVLYSTIGEHRKALPFLEAAARLHEKSGDRRRLAMTLHNLALAHSALRETAQAVAEYDEALAIFRARGDVPAQAQALNNLGVAWLDGDEPQKALAALGEALALRQSMADRRGEAQTLNNLATLHEWLGDHEAALDDHSRALAARNAVGDRYGTANTLASRALIYAAAGDLARARTDSEEALRILREAGDRHGEAFVLNNLGVIYAGLGERAKGLEATQEALSLRRGLGDRHGEAITLANLGALQLERGDEGAALQSLEAALALARELEDLRGEAAALHGLARIHARRDELLAARAELERSLDIIDSLRRRIVSNELRATFLGSRQSARESYIDVLVRLGLTAEALQASEKYRMRALAEAIGAPGEDAGECSTPDLATIQSTLLNRDQVLLEYSLGDERSHLFVVTPTATRTLELPPRQTIEKAAQRVYELLAARNERPRFETASERRARIAAADRAFPAAAAHLAKMILAPARQLIDGRRMLVVADGALRLVPFAALPDPRNPRQPLIESYEIAGVPSMSVLALVRRELRNRAEPAGAVAVVADPLLPAQPRLPHVAEEARSILALVPASESKRALGADASRSLVMGGELANYRYIHFATHAAVDTNRPELSSIFLSSGALRADDVYNLRLPAEMVVLSACRTGLGKDLRSEGVLGLERAFLHAGAARVVVSLWSVSDRATASLMKELYRSILGGARLAPAAALRAAQRATRRREGWSAPYFWAGFTMEGEPD